MKMGATTVVDSNLTTNAVACGIDTENLASVMSTLSNMYRDRSLAVLREYSANARDSHIAAGNPAPIEVSLPTEFSPSLIIQDHGVGLSRDEIGEVYSVYGRSTKKDTNDQVGAFGIGSKAAFALATQFTVTGVKDGWRTMVLFSKDTHGRPGFNVVRHAPTDEPNGVCVSVPVEDVAAMRQAAERLFGTWAPGSVLVDEQAPTCVFDSMTKVSDTIYASGRSELVGLSLVMGGIAYPASRPMLDKAARGVSDRQVVSAFNRLQHNIGLRVIVPIGTVTITPSREDLTDDPNTVAAVRKAVEDYVENIKAAIAAAIDAAPSPMHASDVLRANKGLLPGAISSYKASWRGTPLPHEVKVDLPTITLKDTKNGQRATVAHHFDAFLGDRQNGLLVVTGIDSVKTGDAVRRSASRFLVYTEDETSTLLLANDAEGSVEWFRWGGDSPLATITAADYLAKAKEMPTLSPSKAANAVSYRTFLQEGHYSHLSVAGLKARSGRVILGDRYAVDELKAALMRPGDVVVELGRRQSREALEKRLGKPLVRLSGLLEAQAKEVIKTITAAERAALRHATNERMDILLTVADRITNPAVKALVEQYQAGVAAHKAIDAARLRLISSAMSRAGQQVQHSEYDLSPWPLLDYALDRYRYHFVSNRKLLLGHAVICVNALPADN